MNASGLTCQKQKSKVQLSIVRIAACHVNFCVFPNKDESPVIYYINTSEIPSELSRKNFISSHVKITCYLHM